MAFTEVQRVQIRRYLGWPGIRQAEDRSLEGAITAAQSTGDGGVMADSSTETAIVSYLTSLAAIELQLTQLWESMLASKIETIEIDPARGALALAMEGRRFVGLLADALDVRPRRDVFTAPTYSR
jgi:hypothetical protein